jgi:hypothetical protein
MKGIARMCSAYSQLISTWKSLFDDQLFSIAPLHALPASYLPTVQSVYQQPGTTLEDVFGSVKTE